MIKSTRIRWAKHVACMEERSAYRILVKKHEGRESLEDLGVDGSIILNCIFNKWDGGHGMC
jgi:hypothetical protein